jgi:cbb3-type cytochrome oxidase subunit 1
MSCTTSTLIKQWLLFGRLIRWHNSTIIKSYVLIKCLYNSVLKVPRSIVLSFEDDHFGRGYSWSVLTYVLNIVNGCPMGNGLGHA